MTTFHFSGKALHLILEAGCRDLLPLSHKSIKFILKVLDGVEVRASQVL